jgi:hypothetical protein
MKQRDRKRLTYHLRGRWVGKRCPEYFAGCINCEVWRFYDETGRFPTFGEAHERCHAAMREETVEEIHNILSAHVDDRGSLMSPAGIVQALQGLVK